MSWCDGCDSDVDAPKTKLLVSQLDAYGVNSALLVADEVSENLYLASRNLQKVDVRDVQGMDPVSLLAHDKVMVTGVIQAGSSLGILIPPSVVLVLYAMIARQPVLQLWLAGILPGLLMALLFGIYIYFRCKWNPSLGPALPEEEREKITWSEKIGLLKAGIAPILIFASMMGLFFTGVTSLVESSAVGATAAKPDLLDPNFLFIGGAYGSLRYLLVVQVFFSFR